MRKIGKFRQQVYDYICANSPVLVTDINCIYGYTKNYRVKTALYNLEEDGLIMIEDGEWESDWKIYKLPIDKKDTM